MTADAAAELRHALRERDEARWTVAALKVQLKTLRQRLRREQADHRETAAKLADIRAKFDARADCGG